MDADSQMPETLAETRGTSAMLALLSLKDQILGRIEAACLGLLAMLLLPAMSEMHELSVVGPDAEETTTFDLAALQSLESVAVNTTTIWTEGVQEFVGVPLAKLTAEMTGAFDLRMTAINDYVVTMSSEFLNDRYPIVAYERNGALMSVRDKGPFWLIFPFDEDEAFTTEAMLSRSIWQLIRIEILR